MPRQARVMLINPSGRKLLTALTAEYPEYTWALSLRNDKEVCVGYIDGKPTVVGSDYETIVDNLTFR